MSAAGSGDGVERRGRSVDVSLRGHVANGPVANGSVGPPDVTQALAACGRGEHVEAERMADAVIASGRRRAGHLIRGIVRAQRGNSAGAASDLAAFTDNSTACRGHVQIAVDHARLVRTGRWDPLESPKGSARHLDAPSGAYRAVIDVARGDVTQARNRLARRHVRTPGCDEVATFLSALARALLGVELLDAGCVDAARTSLTTLKRRRIVEALVPVRALVDAAGAELDAVIGENAAAVARRATANFGRAASKRATIESVAWGFASSTALLATGDVAASCATLERVSALQTSATASLTFPAATVRRAWSEIHRGRFESARALLSSASSDRSADVRSAAYAELIGTYLALVDGATSATVFVDLADRWIRQGRLRIAVDTYSLAIGLGAANRRLATRMSGFAGRVGHGYAAVLARHADALDRLDHGELERVATCHLRAGRRARAADALAQAAGLLRANDETRLRARASAVLASCPDYWSPATAELRPVDVDDRLDRAIGAAVVDGLTNDAIASRVHLSSSAVERRLTHLYRRLGVRDRHELREVHAPLFAHRSDPPGSSRCRET